LGSLRLPVASGGQMAAAMTENPHLMGKVKDITHLMKK
jgi:hypothetical protein